MRLYNIWTSLFAGSIILSGCGGGGGGSTTPVDPSETNETIVITEEYQVESLGSSETINATISLGNLTKDLYLVLSNSAIVSGNAAITHNAKVSPVIQEKMIASESLIQRPTILRDPQYVQDFSLQVDSLISKAASIQSQSKIIALPERMEDVVGSSQSFCLNIDENTYQCTEETIATARKIVPNIATEFGSKTLNIWVSNDSFGTTCTKSKCVTLEMVDALAEKFLSTQPGLDNDIYDWVTNIYGEEWGNVQGLIIPNDEITILLTDIDGDNSSNGGVVGFYWSKDNFYTRDIAGSNERVMFYIDSVMFANDGGDNNWDINDYWPKELVSTLAHEFQHMINFYQKNILLGAYADTWISEMLSESTEDIIATKLGHNVESRYPLFNAYNTLSLTDWNYVVEDYAKVNVFGAYLIRNYGGAELLHNIMHNRYENEQAVIDAVNKAPNGLGKTFSDLLREWGVAVMLSDHDNLVNTPELNIGTLFEDVYGSILYEMRSINLFNYIPLPTIYTTSGTVEPQGNYYYKIGENLTGDINITLELNGQTEATLIAK